MIKNKKFQKLLIFINILITIVGAIIVGVLQRKEVDRSFIIDLVYFYIFFIISFFIGVIMHELGHLIGGLLSGYRFVFFRVGSFCLVKYEDFGYKIKKLYMPGTLGQCIMRPPEKNKDNYPFLLYNLGGVIMNIILSSLGYIIYAFSSDNMLRYFCLIFILVNFTIFFMNISPIIGTDGYNILEIKQSIEYKRLFWEALTLDYMKFNDNPNVEKFEFSVYPEEGSLVQYVDLANMTKHIYDSDYEKYYELYNKFIRRDGLHPFYKSVANIDKVYVDLITGDKDVSLDELYKEKDTKAIIKGLKKSTQMKRLELVYQELIEKDEKKLIRLKKEFEYALANDLDLYSARKEKEEFLKFTKWG